MREEGKSWKEIADAVGKEKKDVVKRHRALKAKGKDAAGDDADEGSDTDPMLEGNKASARDVEDIPYGSLDAGENILSASEAS